MAALRAAPNAGGRVLLAQRDEDLLVARNDLEDSLAQPVASVEEIALQAAGVGLVGRALGMA
ncbi:hypothetical protein [Microvirga massiliensis]|uniref:hypothetical protein n=1 Tax=Microvirga massiliensis TaxID=1033741 RepID=UPI00062B31CD|nr:hypothetical protein [Microvirga massiliensis]